MYNKVWVLFIEEVKPWCFRVLLIRTGDVLVFLGHVLIRTGMSWCFCGMSRDVLVFLCACDYSVFL